MRYSTCLRKEDQHFQHLLLGKFLLQILTSAVMVTILAVGVTVLADVSVIKLLINDFISIL